MQIPKAPASWGLNANTVIVLVGFVFTWGFTYSQLETGRSTNAGNIERLETRIIALEGTQRTLENHEIRVNNLEAQARDSSQAMRSVEQAISSLSSDTRLMREILERLERSMNGNTPSR